MAVYPQTCGQLLSSALEGAWRAEPPSPGLSEDEWRRVAPLLVGSGAGPLGWWKLRRTRLEDSTPALRLREAYRYQTLQSALHEREVEGLFGILDSEGIRAVLIKGLAAARLYPETGLRPFGDIDVCVRPAQAAHAARVLAGDAAKNFWVDLHEGFDEADERDFDELYARSETLASGVRVLSAEDHLRLLCVHLLRHGAWRPLWLCDVAAALESRPASFDWSRLLGSDPRRTHWVSCAVMLAQRLLGARIEETPLAAVESRRPPRWLTPEVLKQWETPFSAMQAPMRHRAPMRDYLRRPNGFLKDLINRWPNPIEATIRLGGPLNALPRMPFQVGYAASRAFRFFRSLPKALRDGAAPDT